MRLAHTKSGNDWPLTQSRIFFVKENINLRVQMLLTYTLEKSKMSHS